MTLLAPMTYRTILGSLFSAVILAGCAVGPDYQAPGTELAPFHNLAAASVQPGVATPQLDVWWTGFHDPMLVAVVERALSQNLDLAAALARVREARAAASGAGAQLLPTVDLDASATAEHQSLRGPVGSIAQGIPGFSRDVRDYTVGPAASWEIDLFGGLRRGAAASRDESQAAEADQAGTRITVAADAADAYLRDLDQAMQLVREFPDMGSDCSDVRKGYRRIRSGSHLIYCISRGTEIYVMRILHERQDAKENLRSG